MAWIDHLNAQLIIKGVSACALVGIESGCILADHGMGVCFITFLFILSYVTISLMQQKH